MKFTPVYLEKPVRLRLELTTSEVNSLAVILSHRHILDLPRLTEDRADKLFAACHDYINGTLTKEERK